MRTLLRRSIRRYRACSSYRPISVVESLWLRTIQLSLELSGDGAHAAPRVRLLRGQNNPFAGSFYVDLCNVEAEFLRQAHGLAMPVGKYLRGFYAALLEMYLR